MLGALLVVVACSWLIQVAHNYQERGQRVLVVKPAIDTKSPVVLSRINVTREVDLVLGEDAEARGAGRDSGPFSAHARSPMLHLRLTARLKLADHSS